MTRLIVAGAGAIGRRHLHHIVEHPDLTLAAIVDPSHEARALADAPGFETLQDVDIEADGIVIATPTQDHEASFAEAVRRGWGALIEKPIAHSLEAADRMVELSRTSGVPILTGHHRRFHPRVRQLQNLIATRIGQPVIANVIWAVKKPEGYFDVPWRAGADGAPVRMNVSHEIDLLQFLFGEVTGVVGLGANPVRGAKRVESGGVVMSFASGLVATIAFADTTPTPWGFEHGSGENPNIATTGQTSLRVAGTQGGVEFPSLRTWEGSADWGQAPTPHDHPTEDGVPLVLQLEHFARVLAGREAPINDGASGQRTLDLTLQVEASTLPGA